MKLFENKVGRPSNETLKKRKMFYLGVVASVFLVILLAVLALSSLSIVKLTGTAQNFNKGEKINIPKSAKVYLTKTSSLSLIRAKNEFYVIDVYKAGNRVKISKKAKGISLGWVNISDIEKTSSSSNTTITSSKYEKGDVNRDGKITNEDVRQVTMYISGLKELDNEQQYLADMNKNRKVEATDVRVIIQKVEEQEEKTTTTKPEEKEYTVKYDRAGSTTKMDGAELRTDGYYYQIFTVNVGEKLSSTKLVKSGKEHVGYMLSMQYNGTSYKFGCLKTNCSSLDDAKWYTQREIDDAKKQGKTFYYNIYERGRTVYKLGGNKGIGNVITLTAKYCNSNQKYDKTKSACVSKNTTTKKQPTTIKVASSGKYSIDSKYYITLVATVCQEDSTGYTGAKAVIDTMLNRIDNTSKFPNTQTLYYALTHRCEFYGYYNCGTGEYDYRRRLNDDGTLKSSCSNAKKAVDDALANPTQRSHDYLYFCAKTSCSKGELIGANRYRK